MEEAPSGESPGQPGHWVEEGGGQDGSNWIPSVPSQLLPEVPPK